MKKYRTYKYKSDIISIFIESNSERFINMLSKIIDIYEIDIKTLIQNEMQKIRVCTFGNFYNFYFFAYDEIQISERAITISRVINNILGILDYYFNNSSLISFHASSVFFNKNLIMFMNKSGNGKTTALCNLLYRFEDSLFISDDRVLISPDLKLYGINNSISLKKGTKTMLKLDKVSLSKCFKKNSKKIWFLKPKNKFTSPIILNEQKNYIIIINYNPNVDFNIKPIEGADMIKNLISNCYNISTRKEECLQLFLKIKQYITMFSITYSNNKKFLSFIKELGAQSEIS